MKIPPPPRFIRDAAGSAAPGPAVPGPEIRQKSGGFLNQTTLIIILLIFAGYLVFQGIKSFQLRSMNTALRAKDCVMKTATVIQENAEDILAEAQQINEKREAEEAQQVQEDALQEDGASEQEENEQE